MYKQFWIPLGKETGIIIRLNFSLDITKGFIGKKAVSEMNKIAESFE